MENAINTQQVTTETAQPTANEGGIVNTVLNSNVINVLIVVVFVVWLVRKYDILSVLVKRKNEILETIHNVKEERRIKQNELEKTKLNVKNSDQEVAKMLDEGEEVAESISERIIKNAEQEASDMNKKAQLSIENESTMATNRIMQTITGSAFVIAEQHIKNTIDEPRHRKFIDDFIENMDKLKV